jgi:hypothetical protein
MHDGEAVRIKNIVGVKKFNVLSCCVGCGCVSILKLAEVSIVPEESSPGVTTDGLLGDLEG